MKLTKEALRKIVKEEINDLNSNLVDSNLHDNLRSAAISDLVQVMEQLKEQSDVMGVNAKDIIGAIQNCIQKIQEEPPV